MNIYVNVHKNEYVDTEVPSHLLYKTHLSRQ